MFNTKRRIDLVRTLREAQHVNAVVIRTRPIGYACRVAAGVANDLAGECLNDLVLPGDNDQAAFVLRRQQGRAQIIGFGKTNRCVHGQTKVNSGRLDCR